MEQYKWLLLSYKLPSDPSSKRVSIWRKIKGLGAVYIQNGVCILPNTDEHQRNLKIIQNEILNIDGESSLLNTVGFDKRDEENLISRFNEERNLEYQEFFSKCRDYVAEINNETEANHFSYAELQENDEDLKKLKNWLEKIKRVDFYGAPLLPQAEEELSICEQMLEEFAHKVFDAEEMPSMKKPFE